MDPSVTAIGALLIGLATSLHCVGMCGPIACGLGGLAKTEGQRLAAAAIYHGCRLLSYGIIGAICGALGQQPLQWFFNSPAVLLPWIMVGVLLLIASGLDKRLPRPTFVARLTARARFKASRYSASGAAATIGLLTPFLPCGPLYAVFLVALLAGSPAKGAELTITFGLGTVPLLWLAQHQFDRIRMKLAPRTLSRVQRGLALLTALMLAWRLHSTIPPQWYGQEPPPVATPEEPNLPSCCH
ncbi:MAG: sulfite exporter TauE/SafE family protein [Akkermansiaceae bacterium]|nr:sulfite exporter TauE/SafE family protein [Akkermansiaceae bacterium]MCF7732292.1 sulfite exporter TauE/SafE family protein [Akkermansiaceae bacterium]